jgi:hypothetical protein
MTRLFFMKLSNAKFHIHTWRYSRPSGSKCTKVRTDSDSDDPQRIVESTHRREHNLKLCWSLWRFAGIVRISFHDDAAYDRRQRWTGLGPLAFTGMLSASQLDNTICGSQGQRGLPFRIVDKKVREPLTPIFNIFRDSQHVNCMRNVYVHSH